MRHIHKRATKKEEEVSSSDRETDSKQRITPRVKTGILYQNHIASLSRCVTDQQKSCGGQRQSCNPFPSIQTLFQFCTGPPLDRIPNNTLDHFQFKTIKTCKPSPLPPPPAVAWGQGSGREMRRGKRLHQNSCVSTAALLNNGARARAGLRIVARVSNASADIRCRRVAAAAAAAQRHFPGGTPRRGLAQRRQLAAAGQRAVCERRTQALHVGETVGECTAKV